MAGRRTDKGLHHPTRSGFVGDLEQMRDLPSLDLLKPEDVGLDMQTVQVLEGLVGKTIGPDQLEDLASKIHSLRGFVACQNEFGHQIKRQDVKRTLQAIAKEADDSKVLKSYNACDASTKGEISVFFYKVNDPKLAQLIEHDPIARMIYRKFINLYLEDAAYIRAAAVEALKEFAKRSNKNGSQEKGYRVAIASEAERIWVALGGKEKPGIWVKYEEEGPKQFRKEVSPFVQFISTIFMLAGDEPPKLKKIEAIAMRARTPKPSKKQSAKQPQTEQQIRRRQRQIVQTGPEHLRFHNPFNRVAPRIDD